MTATAAIDRRKLLRERLMTLTLTELLEILTKLIRGKNELVYMLSEMATSQQVEEILDSFEPPKEGEESQCQIDCIQ